MKIYEETCVKKSWSLQLIKLDDFGDVHLYAVDSITGEMIVTIISFLASGGVYRGKNCKKNLERAGYDPYEHGNAFDDEGRIVINN